MATIIGVIFLAGVASLFRQLGKAKSSRTAREFLAVGRAHSARCARTLPTGWLAS